MQTATVETLNDREAWLKLRSTGIGSSDAPVILGLSKWKSPLSLYYEKLGLREPSKGEIEYVEWGLALEPAIIQGYQRVTHRATGRPTDVFGIHTNVPTRYTVARDAELPYLIATPDAAVLPIDKLSPVTEAGAEVAEPPVFYAPGVLEVKNVDVSKGRDWEATQEPPIEYTVQVQHQLMVTGAAWGSIAALVGGNRFMWADIPRDEELIAMLRKLEVEFWERVLTQNPPPVDGSESTKALFARLYPRDTGEVKELPIEALEWDKERIEADLAIKEWKLRKDTAENKLRNALADATVGVLPGGLSYSLKYQKRRAHQVAESEYRVLRRHGGKGDE
ncbi:MAG TPA: YqaJ viral recombinase family protein [Polyangiaceae bacterium]